MSTKKNYSFAAYMESVVYLSNHFLMAANRPVIEVQKLLLAAYRPTMPEKLASTSNA